MDYIKILKDSYQITIKHRYLWLLGIFAGGTAFSGGWNTSSFSSSSFSEDYQNLFSGSGFSWETVWANYWGLIVAAIGLMMLFGLFWMVFSVICQGGLLDSVRSIEQGKKNNFRLGLIFGWHKFWRIFAVGLILGLFVLLSIAILVVPIVLFAMAKIYVLAVIYGLLVFFLALAFWLYIGLMQPYILRLAVLSDMGAWEAITSSYQFFKKNWKEILIIYLLMIAVGIVVALGYLLVLFLLGGILFLLGLAIYLVSAVACWIFAGVAILALLVVMFILAGTINAFSSSVTTLVYLELKKS